MSDAELVDPYSQEALDAPGPYYDALRQRCPVAHVKNDATEFYIVSGYQAARKVMTDHESFSKRDGSFLFLGDTNVALNQDPPAFDDFRKIYINYMGPGGVARWADDMRRFANELIDEILPLGRGDFHDLFAMRLPMRVMALAVGIPQDNLAQYKEWSDTFMNKAFNAPKEVEAAIQTLYAFFDTQFEERRQMLRAAGITEPGPEHVGTVLPDNLISLLVVSRYQGRYLTDQELRRVTRGFFIGGNETTTSLILNILVRMSEKPERWEKLRANPQLIPNVVEESLRCDPPTLGMFRGTTCPVQIGDVTIPKDARVMFSIPSANRDPEVFPHATEFDMERPTQEARKHVAFSYGTHFCPGGWLSRLETKIALEVLTERMPKLRVTGPGTRIEPFNFWGRKTLPVAWD